MYTSKNFQIRDEETFSLCIPTDRDYKILQLTDLHLGFGMFSGKKDRLALAAVTELIRRTGPDLMVLTGDSVFPFFPKSGTMNNRKQAEKLLAFLDGFQIPYTLVFGNHDCEMGSTCNKEQLAEIFTTGKYAVFTKGRYDRVHRISISASRYPPLFRKNVAVDSIFRSTRPFLRYCRVHKSRCDRPISFSHKLP